MIAVDRLRGAARRAAMGVEVGASLNVVGTLLRYLSLAFVVPAAVALGYGEEPWPFVAAGALTATCGWLLDRGASREAKVGAREGFLVVSLTWLLAAAFGALPYLFANEGQIDRPLDALFESMSGFTTTGSSVVTDFEGLSHGTAIWRQLSQWIGGMGIIILALAVLPRLHVGGRQLFEHELPGPEIEPLTARIRDTARRLWLLYAALTALEVLVLAVLGWSGLDERMSPYEAIAHALTTMPIGGFSTQADSIAAFGAATQWAIAAFMVVAGTNLALTYRALLRRRPGVLVRDEEFRLYLGLLLLAALIICVDLLASGILTGEAAVRHAVFQAVSIMTTTGFVSADFTTWTLLTAFVLLALMFAGGSAGSTAGSIKIVRHLLLARMLRRELDQTVHPEAVVPIRLAGATVDEQTLRGVSTFILLYVGIWALGALGIAIEAERAGLELGPFEAAAASAATLGNVGPSFGFAGPFGSFEPFSDLSMGIMTALMWLGRLEIVPVAVLLTRSYWR